MRDIFDRIYVLENMRNLTEEERKELNELKAIQMMQSKKKSTDDGKSVWYNPEDYGMCLSQWGWM